VEDDVLKLQAQGIHHEGLERLTKMKLVNRGLEGRMGKGFLSGLGE
jgi:hypothetical protein